MEKGTRARKEKARGGRSVSGVRKGDVPEERSRWRIEVRNCVRRGVDRRERKRDDNSLSLFSSRFLSHDDGERIEK